MPDDITRTHKWLSNNMLPVGAVADPAVLRHVLEQFHRKPDGNPAAAKTVLRKKATFHNFLEFAVDEKVVTKNHWKSSSISRPVVDVAHVRRPSSGGGCAPVMPCHEWLDLRFSRVARIHRGRGGKSDVRECG
jgi:hypothetical protein